MYVKLVQNPSLLSSKPKIRYVILDEIHMLGQEGTGIHLEHALELLQCPFLALSATISNSREFCDW